VRHFLQYWKSAEADRISGKPLSVAGSGQFERIRLAKGDVLWIVTIRDRRLKLLGRLHVERIINKFEAEQLLPRDSLYQAEFYALSNPLAAGQAREVDINDLAPRLRFKSAAPELVVVDEEVDGRQLQAIRELDLSCIPLLEMNLARAYQSLVSILEGWGFDLSGALNRRMKVVRHTSKKFSVESIYRSAIEYLETYQSYQSKPIFDDCDYIVSFIGEADDYARFVGIYRKLNRTIKGEDTGFAEPAGPHDLVRALAADTIRYEFERDRRFDGFRDRLVIRWTGGAINWVQWLPANDKSLVEVEGSAKLLEIADNIAAALGMKIQPTGVSLDDEESLSFSEGATRYAVHLVRERNQMLIDEVKRRAMARDGRLACEVCGFDFTEVYGELGAGFIEAHHTIPVSEMDENDVTRIEDLVLLCPNCHRMVHRRRPWVKRHELTSILRRNQN